MAAVRGRQLKHISSALHTAAAQDASLTGRLIVQKDSHAAPPRVGAPVASLAGTPLLSTSRRSGGTVGSVGFGVTKSFAGLTMDERKATQAAKQAMLAASFLGYKNPDGTFVQSSRTAASTAVDGKSNS